MRKAVPGSLFLIAEVGWESVISVIFLSQKSFLGLFYRIKEQMICLERAWKMIFFNTAMSCLTVGSAVFVHFGLFRFPVVSK
ncbi:MAG: hypothetical protein J6031_04535 [Bacteroidales bacterium]|nr:hypothetical protein [Bacteroidales bacterium]